MNGDSESESKRPIGSDARQPPSERDFIRCASDSSTTTLNIEPAVFLRRPSYSPEYVQSLQNESELFLLKSFLFLVWILGSLVAAICSVVLIKIRL